MTKLIKVIQTKDASSWDNYIWSNEKSNPYHLDAWQCVISEAYRHKAYALAAIKNWDLSPDPHRLHDQANIKGILPLMHLNSFIFGNRLVSMPFFDHGGVLADDAKTEKELIEEAILLAQKLKAERIELRQLSKINYLHVNQPSDIGDICPEGFLHPDLTRGDHTSPRFRWTLQSHKVRLILQLPDSPETLLKSFKSKLRSQINRPIKAGFVAKISGNELMEDFYTVFSANMRDLGSPVHAKSFLHAVIDRFPNQARIVVIYKGSEPVAASVMVGFKDMMINPWASALRKHSKYSPNMLLYWSMLSYACDQGYRHFDFGRSTPDEGTYRFKTQWGAQPQDMYWYTIMLNTAKNIETKSINGMQWKRRAIAENLWRRLPVKMSRIIGPMIRKHIEL